MKKVTVNDKKMIAHNYLTMLNVFKYGGYMIKKISISDIQLALSPNYVRVSQIIYFSIIMGASTFFLIIIFMYLTGSGIDTVSERSIESLNRFTMIHAALFFSGLALSNILYNRLLREDRIDSMPGGVKLEESANLASGYLAVIRTAKIIRIAVIEMPVFFGLVTCFMAVTNRVVYQYPYYWANALSYIIFIIILIKDFPTKDKLVELFKNKLKFLLQY
jgi:hypothetical protein